MEEKALILVGLPGDFASVKSKLELYFRNKRKSGGEISEIRNYPNDKRKALLIYVEDEAAKTVLEKGPHKVDFKALGVVELQVKPQLEDGVANVKIIKPVPLPRRPLEKEAGFGKSAPNVGEAEPGPFHQEGLQQVCGDNVLSLLVSSDRPIKEDILRLYFEQFTDDIDIRRCGNSQWILKLTSQSDLENVLAKKDHDLEGCLMSVQLYDEKKAEERLDPRRFILSGFSEDCKCSHLSVFIKSCSKGAEHSWEVLNDGERIAVTFKQDIDVQLFLKKCSSKKLQNFDISASRLEYTDTVLVEGNMENISEEVLRAYFSSRSKGGQVKCMNLDNKPKSVLIEFDDFHVANSVAEEKHNICGVSLCALLYYSSLQQALTGEKPITPPSPHEFSIPVDALFLEYIQNEEVCKEDFESTLKELNTSISFKADPEISQVVLEMAVDRESLLLHRLARTWERKTKQAAEALLEKYSIVMLMSTEEVWDRVKDKCLSLNLKTSRVTFESTKNSVMVVGQQNEVKKLQGEIQLLLNKAKEELDVEKNTVERKIPVDSKEELDFVWNLVSANLGGVQHQKDEVNLTFNLKGLRDKVNAAEGIIKNTKDDLSIQTLHLSPDLAMFLQSLDLKQFERDHFTHISATVFSFGDSIQILAEKQDGEKARDKIKQILTEDVINLTPDQRKVTQEEHWSVFYHGIMQEVESSNNTRNIKISHSGVQIAVCGFQNVVTDVARKLRGYLNNKMPVTEDIQLNALRQVEYIDACMKLSEAPEMKALDVTIMSSRTPASPCLKVTAASDNIKEAVAAVKRQISNIVHEKHIYSNAGESKVLEKHQDALKGKAKDFACKLYLTVEQASQTTPPHLREIFIVDSDAKSVEEFHTVLKEKGYQSTDSTDTMLSVRPAKTSKQATAPPPRLPKPGSGHLVDIGGIKVILKKGDITKEAVDAIVNSNNKSLNLDTGVSGAILKAAGKSVQDECAKLGTQNEDGVVVTGGGNLKCKHIIQMVGPTTTAGITTSTERVLQLCESKNTTAVSFPAIGTGRGNIKPEESIKAILKGLENHLSKTTSTTIKFISIVAFEQTLFDTFCHYIAERNQQSQQSKEAVTGFCLPSIPSRSMQLPAYQVDIGGVTVSLKKGDITNEAVDAIVNSTSASLNLDTGVSGAILKAAGESVVNECAKLGTQKEDGVVVTGGGNLKCKHIIQMVGPTTTAGITTSTERVLQLCESKNTTAVSFPAIGTGRGNIKPEESIKAILKGLQNHLSQTTSTTIKFIFIVTLEQKVFDSFCHYFEERNQQSLQRKEAVTGFHLPSIQSRSMQLPANQVKIHGIRIEVKKGDITTETVRGIVNTTNNELNLKGGVSGAIFRAAGSLVEEECKTFGPQQDDGVVVTSGGALQCDFIIHMVEPHSSAAATSQVEKVLEQCEKNNITTVSFPAIGTGGGKLSAADVIDAMLLGFHNHLSQHISTVLKLMYIVVYEDKILQNFLQGLKQWSIPELDTSDEEEDDMELSTTSELDTEDEDMDEDDNEGSIEIIMGPIKVKALCGDITQETTDVIVSSTNTSLDLSSGVSGAILKAAGQTVLDECRALGTQPKDGVVITKPGNLKCKHIVHMVGQTKERDITNSMSKVLETCDHIKAQTVAFPALGTGAGNLTASQVANAMTDAISYFILDKPKSSITTVNIVIFQPKMISDFGQVMKKFKGVTPMPGVAGEIAAHRRLPTPPSSSLSQTNSNIPSQSLESMTADITFPVMVAEVYGASVANLAQVKKCLDDLISEECTSQDVVDNHLHLLAEKDKQDIVETSQRHQVHISMLKNRLTVSGKREDVLFVIMQIKDYLQRTQERESQKREERRIWQTVRWKLGRSDAWTGLKKQINCELELAFHKKDKFYTYQNEKGKFAVDFEKMEQTDSRGQISRIKRTPFSDSETAIITTPPTWTKMDGKDLDIILLLENSDEFQKLSEGFVQSCQVFAQENSKKIEVVQIQRIQHQEQWRKYAVSKQALDKKYPKSDNEQLLYHGTTKDICQKINKNGFNRSFCGRNATMYGCGTYFAKEAHYSCHDKYSNPDGNGHKYIYRARVLTGKPCLGLQGMKAPSPVDPNNLQTGLHDCAVDNLQNPFIFVIFCDSGAYPEYLITFKTV
ncbi:protein mono-ADP-ribosyltransferase PARP14-like [Conger conger]|uniref:protein mono-ADP-ribosyltransferase PARP14-like n=1 Tax=Conger conger TaxID=82655 RepID=UPI002A5A1345|nr:protein mono-ADP-ribosyltransferase PARP14-like [Conger conger]